ncbi:pimeloyl-ACP methyl ester carboxylesterase [Kibdelosporangium banguiense]|uniref:Pimeloyl-ACP methyl ester carboxylesterase n=1 Tax=Kibdelosporangium banguiense TaxID=1365924 RepID=A0ABS4TV08_9PSEU|nr:epoxide hydrolase [Kibdelosporangium banguiense]MBP2327773.1 pimeloyl-ACP methyl ester carboxylesterase [Kibdelosporangium banguiense]
MSNDIRPFRIDIPQADLDDLHTRLAMARFPNQLRGDGWSRGVPVSHLREVAEYWRTTYDWRAHEARLNEFPQYITEIDGLGVHFLHVRSPEPDALPLVLTHGWPNTFVEFADLIGLLRDFHVVVPSVPGFGFSDAPKTSFGAPEVADMWVKLMQRLGYDRYGVEGGDFGAYVAPEMAKIAPDRVAGVYIIGGLGFPTEADLPEMTEEERAGFAWMMDQDWIKGVDHHALLRSAPQTFAYGWNDSPVAALAWMTQKFHEFNASGKPLEEAISRDAFLTNLSLYWFTGTFGTSAWPYFDSTEIGWPEGQPTVPTGVYNGPPGIRRFAERTNKIVHWPENNPAGHHFVAMDEPSAFAADIREFFAKVR